MEKQKVTCSNCIHRKICYHKIEFPQIVELVEKSNQCQHYQIEFYDYVLQIIQGFEV